MGASTVASQRPLPFPGTHSTRFPSHASTAMPTIPSDGSLESRPSPSSSTGLAPPPLSLTAPSTLPLLSFTTTAADSTKPSSTSNDIVLTPPGPLSDGFPPPSSQGNGSQPSQSGGPPLYYSNQMTGSWPTPGLSQASAYTYSNSTSGTPGSGQLAQPPYARAPTSYGSASSPSLQHFPGRSSSSAPNSDGLPAPHSYQDQQGFTSPVGTGNGNGVAGGSLGSPLTAQGQGGGNQQSGLQSLLGNPTSNPTRQAPPSQNSQGTGPGTSQDGNSYRQPPTPTSYYPPTSASQQQPFQSYTSPVTQPSPTTASPVTSSGSIPRGPTSIPAMAPPVQFSSARTHAVPSMASYASYNPIPGPVLSNMHHPGAPLAMVSGMSGLPSYGHHHAALSPHHPHHLYVHHPGGPSPQSERPFKCNECTQAFNRNHDLKRHQRIHLAIKPFPCSDCDKRFSRKDALKRHRLVKGCGGASPTEPPGAGAGGSVGSPPLDRGGAGGGGDGESSPRMAKKGV